MSDDKCFVKVIAYEDGKCVKKLGPMDARKASKVDDGINRNLDHDNYYTVIVTER